MLFLSASDTILLNKPSRHLTQSLVVDSSKFLSGLLLPTGSAEIHHRVVFHCPSYPGPSGNRLIFCGCNYRSSLLLGPVHFKYLSAVSIIPAVCSVIQPLL